jgi:putative membrane protein insertion efficiency factor
MTGTREPGRSPGSSVAAITGICVVRAYQWTLRPFIGAHCRFWPSCSEYAIEAFRQHGGLKGSLLAGKRVLRCNPWHPGGVDPVPGSMPEPGPMTEGRTGY